MDDRLLKLQAKKQRLDSYKPLRNELIKNLEEWFRIELTYTSNAIEGNTLTRQETAMVVEEGITVKGKSLTEHQEAISHAEAFDYIQTLVNKKRQELTTKDILDIHSIILNKIDDTNKGKYRTVAVRLRGSETILPNPLKVSELMDEFITWLKSDISDHPVKIAIDAHYKLVSIHPFVDGNGRTARLLMNLLLMQSGYPSAIVRKEDRSEYINSLEKGQTKNDTDDYDTLMLEAVDHSLDIYLEAVEPEKVSAEEPTLDQRFYTTDEVAKLLQVDPESVRRYVRRGDLKAVKLGGKFIRIDKTDLEKFIESLKS
ncbi:MAG: Fic family protein [Candidatus Levyibacteriota bacterium]|nr:MAG: Fic family protein [Candidatus Levybacteria bacterium]